MKFFLSVFFITVFQTVNAQEVFVSASSFDDFSYGYSRVIGQDENGYYILTSNRSIDMMSERSRQRSRRYRLGYFSTTLTLKWKKEIEAPDNLTLDNISFVNNRIIVISSREIRNENSVEYYLNFIDSTGAITNNITPLTRFTGTGDDYDKCKIITSSTRHSFALVTLAFNNDDTQTLFAASVNPEFSASAVKSCKIPFPEKTFEFTGYAVSNNGDIAMLGLNAEKIKAMSSKRKLDYLLYSAPADSIVFTEFNITNNKQITGISIEFDNVNRQAVMAGFYAEKDSYVGAGIYYASLSMNTHDQVVIKSHSISEHDNLKLKGERNSGAGIELISYPIERIILRQDGGAVIIAEAAYTSEYSYYDSFSQSYSRRIEYNYENVLVISVNSDGKTDWSNIIEKRQSSLDDGGVFSSFCSLLNSEQIVIIFNDQISKRNKIQSVSVNNLGGIKLLNPYSRNESMLLIPRNGKQVSQNEIVIPALIKRKLYFVKFKY